VVVMALTGAIRRSGAGVTPGAAELVTPVLDALDARVPARISVDHY